MTETTDHGSEQQARAQLASIRDMVAALECDYDRLQELRDERDAWEDEHGDARDWPDAMELDELEEAAGDCSDRDDAERRIHEDPLSVQVRGGWHDPGAENEGPEEFEILLCTGGPACRLVGALDQHGEPCRVRIEHQDWFTPWTEYVPTDEADRDASLAYVRCFYFGE